MSALTPSTGHSDAGAEDLAALRLRIGRAHLRHRLGLEGEHEARVFRMGTHFFHLENWVLARALLHAALTLAGLRGRGRRNTLRIELRHHDVVLAGLPAAFEGYTLLHLSDLHLDLSESHLSRLVERVRGLASRVAQRKPWDTRAARPKENSHETAA